MLVGFGGAGGRLASAKPLHQIGHRHPHPAKHEAKAEQGGQRGLVEEAAGAGINVCEGRELAEEKRRDREAKNQHASSL